MTERDGANGATVYDGLRVRPVHAAGGGVAGVPDRYLAGQGLQLLLVEHARHEPHLTDDGDAPALGDRDAGGLLAAMLKREQTEIRQPGNVAFLRADAEHAAHQVAQASRSSSRPRPKSVSPPTSPMRRTATSVPSSVDVGGCGGIAITAPPPPSPKSTVGSSGTSTVAPSPE